MYVIMAYEMSVILAYVMSFILAYVMYVILACILSTILALNEKSQNSFCFDFKSGTNLLFLLVFELGLVAILIFFGARFKSNNF